MKIGVKFNYVKYVYYVYIWKKYYLNIKKINLIEFLIKFLDIDEYPLQLRNDWVFLWEEVKSTNADELNSFKNILAKKGIL